MKNIRTSTLRFTPEPTSKEKTKIKPIIKTISGDYKHFFSLRDRLVQVKS